MSLHGQVRQKVLSQKPSDSTSDLPGTGTGAGAGTGIGTGAGRGTGAVTEEASSIV